MIKRKAYSISMTYDISTAEKMHAEKALICFNSALHLLNIAADHLNIIETPFKDHADISNEQLIQFRAAFRRYRDKSIENFNAFKREAFKCISYMQPFANDTQATKLIKSFISSIEKIERQVNSFSELFNDLKSKDFVKNIVSSIDGIKKDIDQLKELIDDRIKTHIQVDILGKSWVNTVGDEMQMKIEKKTPLLIDLNKKRQEELNELGTIK